MESTYLNIDMCKFESSQKIKAQPSRLIPRKPTANLELLIAVDELCEKNNQRPSQNNQPHHKIINVHHKIINAHHKITNPITQALTVKIE